MENDINNNIKILYEVFKPYTILGNLRERSCDCCVTNRDIKALLSKQLNDLSEEDLGHFSRKAITTFGDVEDYKHFLPRILELMKINKDVIDDFITFEKLNYCKWLDWDIKEVVAIKNYFLALLFDALSKDSENIYDYILLNLEYNSFDSLSEILLKSNSKKFLMSVIENTLDTNKYYKDNRLEKLFSNQQILNQVEQLYFEEKNGDKANRISIAYSILENRKNYENKNIKQTL